MQARLRLILILIFLVATITFLTIRILAFANLFFEHSGIAITQTQVRDAHAAQDPDPRLQLIPKHIHQVYHDWRTHNVNATVPADWQEVSATCRRLMPDWNYTLWTEQASRDFIESEYPWFLSTYDGYAFPVQRVDSVRYFILRHYGGIYLDLDNGCLEDLTPVLYYPTWITDGGRGALSNNILASMPLHPFWILLTDSLIPYNWYYFFPYVTISYASGQWFETAIWETYHASLPAPSAANKGVQQGQQEEASQEEKRLYRMMMDDRPGADPWIFFDQQRGGTWVNWDNAFFLWIGDHLILLGLGVCGLLGLVWWGVRSCFKSGAMRKGYRKVNYVI